MRRLIRLWALYARMDLIWVMRDVRSFVGYFCSDLVQGAGAVAAVLLLTERFHGIGEWSRPQVIFLLGYATVVRGVLDTLFNYNVLMISRRIGRGQLDHTLVQPQPLWMALLTEGFAPFSGSAILAVGLGLLAWGAALQPGNRDPAWLALLGVNLAGSTAVLLSLFYLWGSRAFWAPRAAEEISSSTRELVDQLRPFPLDGAGAAVRSGLMTVLPLGFAAWYPSRALLGLDPSPAAAWTTALAAAAFGSLAVLVFRQGLHHYARTGSSRYLSMGHRR